MLAVPPASCSRGNGAGDATNPEVVVGNAVAGAAGAVVAVVEGTENCGGGGNG